MSDFDKFKKLGNHDGLKKLFQRIPSIDDASDRLVDEFRDKYTWLPPKDRMKACQEYLTGWRGAMNHLMTTDSQYTQTLPVLNKKDHKMTRLQDDQFSFASKILAVGGVEHTIVTSDTKVDLSKLWAKLAKMLKQAESNRVIDLEARGGFRVRISRLNNNRIDYGLWQNGIQVVDGMITTESPKSVQFLKASKLVKEAYRTYVKLSKGK